MSAHNCPNCGNALDLRFESARMTTCGACDTTLFLDGAQFRAVGAQGVMHKTPMLMALGETVILEELSFDIVGHARFDYGPGWWDEFWAIDPKGEGAWVSVDEGEVILQRALASILVPKFKTAPTLGAEVGAGSQKYRVVEADTATCVALAGDLPEVLRIGARYDFVNCTDAEGRLLSGEFSGGEVDWYVGTWIDPFDVEKVVTS